MEFTSLHFAVFFSVVIVGLLILRQNDHKITWLLLAGVFFYGYWDWRFLALLGFTSIFDYALGIRIASAQGLVRRRLLVLDILVNLGILIVFKYNNFFIESANLFLGPLGLRGPSVQIVLPIGISFFVFEAMSYCVDIYRGDLEPYTDWRHFALFIFFFPRMIAGPIIRASDFLPQLKRDISITWANIAVGGQLFLLGLTKKVVIADRLAGFVDLTFAHPERFSSATVWQAVIGYSIQIYCDFSGYSDMALGLAKVLGFDLPINFRMPYLATSLTEFWRRWHISLSSWLRDYLYIPLGGNRLGPARTYVNLLITMTLGGLWHGASWNFVFWGFMHGLGLAANKAFASRWPQPRSVFLRILGVSFALTTTFLFVCFCWIFFRAQTFSAAWLVVGKMVGIAHEGIAWRSSWLVAAVIIVISAHVFGLLRERGVRLLSPPPSPFLRTVIVSVWIVGVYYLSSADSAPFIYFQF